MIPESTVMPVGIGIYITLMWLFVFVITVLMLSLCYVFLSMRRAMEREAQSLEFSHLIIEGLEKERRRVSRELHDTVLPLVRDREVSNLIRSICREFQPPDFSRISFKDSLVDLSVQFTQKTGIECVYFIENELDFTRVSSENQLHLYRMVQEALTNIEKHSGSRRASLAVRRSVRASPGTPAGNILICVSDEGTGLRSKPGAPVDESLGMKNMRQRAAILGAKLDFISESGNGLMVRIEIPPIGL